MTFAFACIVRFSGVIAMITAILIFTLGTYKVDFNQEQINLNALYSVVFIFISGLIINHIGAFLMEIETRDEKNKNKEASRS
jgi:Co/Zn/Cd efflux system component